VDVTCNTVVLWIHKGGPVMNALHLCFGIGATLAPVLVGRSLAWTHGIRAGYLVVAGAMVVLGAMALTRPSPRNPHMDAGRGLPPGKGRLVLIGVAFFISYVGVELGFAGWIFDYGVARGLNRVGQASWLGTGFLAAFTVGRLLSIPVAGRVVPRLVLAADVVACLAGLTILLAGGRNLGAMWVGTIVFGLGTASMFPTMLSLAEPHIPSTSAVTSAFLVGAALGSMFVPWIIGALIDRTGASALPWVVLGGTMICALVIVVFDRAARRDSAGAVAGSALGMHA
jgi:FHS family Na+ dependent glucose MFS transporter 1